MSCPQYSHIVNSPNNRVQEIFQNGNGKFYSLDTLKLNQQFMLGNRFDLNQIEFCNIIGCHQELNLVMY